MSYTDILSDYAGLLIVQYKNKPKAIATVKLFANSSVCDGLPLQLLNCFDLDTAFGNQLTIIGKIVGVPRNVKGLNLNYNFFNFTNYIGTPASNGFIDYAAQPDTSGIFLLDYNDSFTYTMTDTDMRTVIKLAILQNSRALTFKNIKEGLWNYFHGSIDVTSNLNSNNILSNSDFETWSAGASSAPDGWILSGTNATIIKNTGTFKIGNFSANLTRVGNDAILNQINLHLPNGIAYWKGRTITLSIWVECNTANRARIEIGDGGSAGSGGTSSYHTGSSTWELLTTTRTVGSDATGITVYCEVNNGNAQANFDGAMCVEGNYTLIPGYDSMRLNYTAKTSYTVAMTVAEFLNLLPHPMCITASVSYV